MTRFPGGSRIHLARRRGDIDGGNRSTTNSCSASGISTSLYYHLWRLLMFAVALPLRLPFNRIHSVHWGDRFGSLGQRNGSLRPGAKLLPAAELP
jgi:hypothetical protein